MASSESAQDGNNNPVEGGEDTTGFCGAEGYSLAAGLALGMVTLGLRLRKRQPHGISRSRLDPGSTN